MHGDIGYFPPMSFSWEEYTGKGRGLGAYITLKRKTATKHLCSKFQVSSFNNLRLFTFTIKSPNYSFLVCPSAK